MRIAEISFNLECGGIQNMIANLSLGLRDLGHDVDLICLNRPTGSGYERDWLDLLSRGGVRVRFLGRPLGRPGVSAIGNLLEFAWRRRYNVLHSHWPVLDAITGLCRRVAARDASHFITVHSTRQPRSRFVTTMASGAHAIYCSAAALRKNPMPAISSTVIPNGIPKHRMAVDRAVLRERLRIPHNATVVIGVGRLSPEKNSAATLEAFAAFSRRVPSRSARLLMCGDGPEMPALIHRASALGIGDAVLFLGSRTDVPELLRASDVFVSASYFEGMPLAVLEALEAGLPCALSAIDEHFEIAGDLAGCSFADPSDSKSLADGIELLLQPRVAAEALATARSPRLRPYSIDACAAAYADLFSSKLQLSAAPVPARA